MKATVIWLIVGVVLTVLLILIVSGFDKNTEVGAGSVEVVDGKQIVSILARGGYTPQEMVVDAEVPTVLKMITRGTFDCSAALVVPSVGYRGILPQSGETLINIPPQKVGAVVQGVCSMGMYSFVLEFR